MNRNDEVRSILEARKRAAEQNAQQRQKAKSAALDSDNLYCRNACWPSKLRTDK